MLHYVKKLFRAVGSVFDRIRTFAASIFHPLNHFFWSIVSPLQYRFSNIFFSNSKSQELTDSFVNRDLDLETIETFFKDMSDAQIKSIINTRASVETEDGTEYLTPFEALIEFSDDYPSELIEYFIEKGADLNKKSYFAHTFSDVISFYGTPLMRLMTLRSEYNMVDIDYLLQLFLHNGANPNTTANYTVRGYRSLAHTTFYGITPLIFMSKYDNNDGNIDIVKDLLRCDADVNKTMYFKKYKNENRTNTNTFTKAYNSIKDFFQRFMLEKHSALGEALSTYFDYGSNTQGKTIETLFKAKANLNSVESIKKDDGTIKNQSLLEAMSDDLDLAFMLMYRYPHLHNEDESVLPNYLAKFKDRKDFQAIYTRLKLNEAISNSEIFDLIDILKDNKHLTRNKSVADVSPMDLIIHIFCTHTNFDCHPDTNRYSDKRYKLIEMASSLHQYHETITTGKFTARLTKDRDGKDILILEYEDGSVIPFHFVFPTTPEDDPLFMEFFSFLIQNKIIPVPAIDIHDENKKAIVEDYLKLFLQVSPAKESRFDTQHVPGMLLQSALFRSQHDKNQGFYNTRSNDDDSLLSSGMLPPKEGYTASTTYKPGN